MQFKIIHKKEKKKSREKEWEGRRERETGSKFQNSRIQNLRHLILARCWRCDSDLFLLCIVINSSQLNKCLWNRRAEINKTYVAIGFVKHLFFSEKNVYSRFKTVLSRSLSVSLTHTSARTHTDTYYPAITKCWPLRTRPRSRVQYLGVDVASAWKRLPSDSHFHIPQRGEKSIWDTQKYTKK